MDIRYTIINEKGEPIHPTISIKNIGGVFIVPLIGTDVLFDDDSRFPEYVRNKFFRVSHVLLYMGYHHTEATSIKLTEITL